MWSFEHTRSWANLPDEAQALLIFLKTTNNSTNPSQKKRGGGMIFIWLVHKPLYIISICAISNNSDFLILWHLPGNHLKFSSPKWLNRISKSRCSKGWTADFWITIPNKVLILHGNSGYLFLTKVVAGSVRKQYFSHLIVAYFIRFSFALRSIPFHFVHSRRVFFFLKNH